MTRLIDRFLTAATVTATGSPTARLREIRLAAPGLDWTPGQHIKVFIGPGLANREYSIWDRDDDGSLVLRVYLHGDGAGATWARGVEAGDTVRIAKPEGHLVGRPAAAYHVFAGDDTAAVAFGAIARALPPAAPVFGVIEVDEPADRPGFPRGEIDWVYRAGASAVASERVVDGVRKLALPEGFGVLYVAGEARTCQQVRRHFTRDRSWPRRNILMTAFWH